jgi:DNA-binding response OmpR family regulator
VRILIADKNRNLNLVLKLEFEEAGYLVDSVSNGVDAVNHVIENDDYTFLLIDLVLPRLDGLNTLKLIKKIRPNVNIIAVSDDMLHSGRNECLRAGANVYFPKPYKIDKIKKYMSEQTGQMKQRIPLGETATHNE